MIYTVKIRNRKTGNIRLVDFVQAVHDDPPDVRAQLARHPPALHVNLDIGEDEEVVS